MRIKFLYSAVDERASDRDLPLLSVSARYGVVPRDFISDGPSRAEDLSNYKVCRPGDIVLNRMSAYQGAVGRSSLVGLVSPDYMIIRPSGDVESRYLHHLFRSQWFVGEMTSRLRGIGSADNGGVRTPRINPEDLGDIYIDFPDLNEQRRIADFLDAETARIEQLTNEQIRLIDLLEERANSQILQLIGESRLVKPDGAPTMPMRRLIQKLDRPVIQTDEVITAFRDGQVTARSLRRNEGYTLPAATEPQGQGVEVGDIIVHGLDGFAGAIGDAEAAGNCTPVYHVCMPIDDGNSAFYGRLLRLLALNGYLSLYGASARERAVDFRNWKMFGRAEIPHVEPAMQHEIGNMISKTRPLREEVKRFNERLAERRQALITAAVTGGITV
jgi:type I restriction enzyme S subunit